MRWKIEVFHKILKSGCRAEDSRLRTAQRLANLIAVFWIVSWRVFWMTMLNRASPDAPAEPALTPSELHVLDHLLTGSDQAKVCVALPDQDREIGRLSCSRERSAARKYRHVARAVSSSSHRDRRKYSSTMWVIESFTAGIPQISAPRQNFAHDGRALESSRSIVGHVQPIRMRELPPPRRLLPVSLTTLQSG